MTYSKLVKALRACSKGVRMCDDCYQDKDRFDCHTDLMRDAAAAIEALQAEVEKWQDIAYQDSLKQEEMQERIWELEALIEAQLPKRGELTADEVETIRIHMNAIKERLCNQNRHNEAEEYQVIVDKLAKMEVQDGQETN